jgi:uncharacterized metal-binding protein
MGIGRRRGAPGQIGLLEEMNPLARILKAQGLEPLYVCCKSCSEAKLELEVEETSGSGVRGGEAPR